MITYIKKTIKGYYVEFPKPLGVNYWKDELGSTYEEFLSGKWVALSEEQTAFHIDNPTASVKEVWDMALIPPYERTLSDAKQEKISQIEQYDSSDSVNSFLVNENSAWISAADRANYKNSIEAAKLIELTSVQFYISNQLITLSIEDAEMMLAQIQLYADACYLTTMQHKQAVEALDTIEAVDAYDYTTGYPEKLNFSI